MILAGDIGGTKVNLGLYKLEGTRVQLVKADTYPSRKYLQLQHIITDFLLGAGSVKIARACLGVAGPVRNGGARLTNLPWRIEALEMTEELKLGPLSLINDLEANAYGLAQLSPEDFHVVNAGDASATGNIALISAGTGLGEAGLYWDGRQHYPFACEGGHCDFSPQTKMDAELFAYLNERFGHVSWEKVLSGSGLHNIYLFLRDTKRGEEPAWLAEAMTRADPAAVISQAAMANTSPLCSQAMDLFVTYYGAEAGNLALKLMSCGGIFIGGGIAPKILSKLDPTHFLKALVDKGRMKPLLEAMPVKVILNAKTALLGAAHYAAFGREGFRVN
ncbi:MAG: glucokinase [Pedosphaera sp.]|nr:glucokinase [Pedosphaera sp.]